MSVSSLGFRTLLARTGCGGQLKGEGWYGKRGRGFYDYADPDKAVPGKFVYAKRGRKS